MPDKKHPNKSKNRPSGLKVSRKKTKKSLSPAKQWGLAILCAIAIICIVGFFVSRYTLASGGKKNPEELAVSFIEALEQQDLGKLKKCLLTIEPNYDDIFEALTQHIQSETGIVSINYDEMTIETKDPDAIADLQKEMGVNGIEETAFSYIQVPITREKEGATYHTVTTYYMTSYKAMDKWYIYDIMKDMTFVQSGVDADGNKIDPESAYRLFNAMLIGGDENIGFIPLDNTWYPTDETDNEQMIDGAITDLAYVQESGNAIIHMVLLESDKTAHELADQLYANLTADKEAAVEVNMTETEINGRKTWHVGFYSQDTDTFFFSYIIDTKSYDGKLRYLTLESTNDYTAASLYLTNFLTPDEHALMYGEIEKQDETTEQ